MSPSKRRVELELTVDSSAPSRARALVDEMTAGIAGDVGFRARLATSELVANSVVHAGGVRIGLSVARVSGSVRVEVRDQGPQFDSHSRVLSLRATSGRGLRLVDALVDRWGVEHEHGNLAWFEIDEPAAGENDPRSPAGPRGLSLALNPDISHMPPEE